MREVFKKKESKLKQLGIPRKTVVSNVSNLTFDTMHAVRNGLKNVFEMHEHHSDYRTAHKSHEIRNRWEKLPINDHSVERFHKHIHIPGHTHLKANFKEAVKEIIG